MAPDHVVLSCSLPETPWTFILGLIHLDTEVGFGVWSTVFPCMSHMTNSHLQQLPAALTEDYPHAEAVALAGRLPGLMKATGRDVLRHQPTLHV
jgi:hypothetical protein